MDESKSQYIDIANTIVEAPTETPSRALRNSWVLDASNVIQVDLVEAKKLAHEFRNNWFNWRAYSEENPVLHEGKEFSSSKDSGSLIDGEVGYARDIEEDSPGSYSLPTGWKAMDNTYLPIPDFAAIKALKAAYRNHYNTAFAESQVKHDLIEAATSEADLVAVILPIQAVIKED